MIRISRSLIGCLGIAGITILSIGCSGAPKTDHELVTKGLGSSAPVNKTYTLFNFSGNSGRPSVPKTTVTVSPGAGEFINSDRLKDPVKVHLAYALWHEQEGNLVEARNSYDKVLEKNPKNVDALLGLARLDIAMSRLDDAERRLVKAQKQAPKDPHVAVAFGQYYSARRDWPAALEQMKIARQLSPYDGAVAYHLGLVQAKSGDLDAALVSFTEAVGAAEAEYNLGYILHEEGNLLAAEEHLQRAISIKHDLPQAKSLLLAMRQKQNAPKQQLARMPARGRNDVESRVQPVNYMELDDAIY